MVVGWWRPVILLPATAVTGLPSDQLALILGHELAHIRRHDYLVNLVQSVIETVLFYHPAVWWISSRIREERENCCDDRAVSLCGDRLEYARALAALEQMRVGAWSLAPSANGGTLLARIRRILGVAPDDDPRARGLAGTVTLTTLAFLGLGLFIAPGTTPALAAIEDQKLVTGTVVTPDEKPVAGADVWLVAESYPEPKALVLDRARSDEAGHYRLNWDETRFQGQHIGSHAVWAHRPGSQPARAMFLEWWTEAGVDPERPIKLTLGPAASIVLRVLDPEGHPVAGAKAAAVKLRDDRTSLPDELAGRLSASTDQEGLVKLEGAPGDLVQTVQVTTRDHGTQRFDRQNGFQAENELRLLSMAPVTGRVTADDPSVVRGVRLHLSGMGKVEEGSFISSLADAITDAEGRFSVPGLVAGYVSIEAVIPDTALYRQVLTENNFDGARKIEITVPLERWVRVRGSVREKGSGKPAEGVGIRFSNGKTVGPIPLVGKTDASGHYDGIAPRGKETFCHLDVPKGYLKLGRGIEMPEITADGQVLPPIELERGVTLRGVVVDEEGKPVAGARVLGKWNRIGPSIKFPNGATGAMGFNFSATSRSNARGEFLLEGVHQGAEVMLEAEAGEVRTGAPQPGAPDAPDPIRLVISGANTVSLEGKVVDSAGAPVPEAVVQIRSRPLGKDAGPDPGPVRFSESTIRTDRGGHFQTPRQLKRGFGYRAEVKPDDPSLMSDSSPWLTLRQDTKPVLENVVLRRLRVGGGQGRRCPGRAGRRGHGSPVRRWACPDGNRNRRRRTFPAPGGPGRAGVPLR